jgi:hypothetical protein
VPVSDSGTTLAIASLFNDPFNRPDNNVVGNGWIETVNGGSSDGSDGSGTAVRLAGNTMLTGGGFAGTPETAATQVLTGHANQDLRITWRFRQTGGNGDSFNLAIRRPTTGTYIVSGQGYGLQLVVNSPNGTICIVDNGSCVVSNVSIPGMAANIDFYAELIAQRDGTVEGRAWPVSESRPSQPQISSPPRNPSATGDAIGIDSFTGSTASFDIRSTRSVNTHLGLSTNRAELINDGVTDKEFVLVVAR